MSRNGRIWLFLVSVVSLFIFLASDAAISGYASENSADDPDSILIEDFSTSTSGEFPKNWGWLDGTKIRKIDEAKENSVPYIVMEENGNKFLHADDQGQAVTILSDKKWNVKKYPCLKWRWRVHKFPTGADERAKGKTDNAASLYVTYYVSFIGVPRTIRYTWSNALPVCYTFRKEGTGKATNTVIESGTERTGEWVTETINIYEHYKEVFGEYPPNEIAAIAVKTDADGTKSRAIADYDDIMAVKECTSKCK